MIRFFLLLKKCISYLAITAMAGIVILVFMNVLLRYLMNSGVTWSEEASVSLFVWFIFLGAVLAAVDGLHLKVDVFTSRLSEKMKKICLLIANLFVLLAMGILLSGGYEVALVTHKNISSATGLPFSYITISLCFFSACVMGFTVYQMITGKELSEVAKGEKK